MAGRAVHPFDGVVSLLPSDEASSMVRGALAARFLGGYRGCSQLTHSSGSSSLGTYRVAFP